MEKPATIKRKSSAIVLKNVSQNHPLYVLTGKNNLLRNMFFIKKMFIHNKESYIFENQHGAIMNLNLNKNIELEIYSPE